MQPSLFDALVHLPIDVDALDKQQLPGSMQILIEILGADGAWQFCCRYGGTSVYIPVSADGSTSQLKNQMTESQFMRFVAELNPLGDMQCWFTVPKPDKMRIQMRNHAIRHERTDGATVRTLARKHNLTERQILNITKHY